MPPWLLRGSICAPNSVPLTGHSIEEAETASCAEAGPGTSLLASYSPKGATWCQLTSYPGPIALYFDRFDAAGIKCRPPSHLAHVPVHLEGRHLGCLRSSDQVTWYNSVLKSYSFSEPHHQLPGVASLSVCLILTPLTARCTSRHDVGGRTSSCGSGPGSRPRNDRQSNHIPILPTQEPAGLFWRNKVTTLRRASGRHKTSSGANA